MRKLLFISIVFILLGIFIICMGSNEIETVNLKKMNLDERVEVLKNINNVNTENVQKYDFKNILKQIHLTTEVYGNSQSFLDTVVEIKGEVPLEEAFEIYKIEKETRKGVLPVEEKDILFIGNSLIDGIRLYGGSECQFLCKVGVSLDGLKSKIYSQIANKEFRVVVIGMGTNELGSYEEEHFKESYEDLINWVYGVNPEVKIYCLSIPPVSSNKSNSNTLFTNENVKEYNGYIREICDEFSIDYIDNMLFFGNVLQSNWTGDGIHLTGNVYSNWYSYVMKNIIGD